LKLSDTKLRFDHVFIAAQVQKAGAFTWNLMEWKKAFSVGWVDMAKGALKGAAIRLGCYLVACE